MTREQIKKIVRLTEAIVNKRLNESASNHLEGFIENEAYAELKSKMPDNVINTLSNLIKKLDNRVDGSKDYDGNDFFDHMEDLSYHFPIDTVSGLFEYLRDYIKVVNDNMVNPPGKVIQAIKQILNTKLTESIVNKKLNESNPMPGSDLEVGDDTDYGTVKSITINKRNSNQIKIITSNYPKGIYLEKDGWGNWVEVDKPLNFMESFSRTPNKRLNESNVPMFERKYKYIIVDPDNSGKEIKVSGTAMSSGSVSPHDKLTVLRILRMYGINARSYKVIETGPQVNESISRTPNKRLNESAGPLRDIEDLVEILGYNNTTSFFDDNPGAFEAVVTWASRIKEFQSMLDDYL
jgi:hypothetical protein